MNQPLKILIGGITTFFITPIMMTLHPFLEYPYRAEQLYQYQKINNEFPIIVRLLSSIDGGIKNCWFSISQFYAIRCAKTKIEELTNPLRIELPDDLSILYEWQNGISSEDLLNHNSTSFCLFTLAYPISIEDLLEIYLGNAIKSQYWAAKYFPKNYGQMNEIEEEMNEIIARIRWDTGSSA